MERKFLFNYDALDNYLNEQQKNQDRTDWELTMLRDNCKKHLKKDWDKSNEYIISVNEDTWDVSINWQTNLQDKFQMLPTWYKMDNKTRLYRQIKLSMEEAEVRWIYEKIFKEIREELDSLKESITESN
jgi:hypothetical protein